MGKEQRCTEEFGGRSSEGKALLETNEILFRGEFRVVIPRKDIQGVVAADGQLRIDSPQGPVLLHLGAAAAKWADKILHPPSRLDKLGVKAGITYQVIGSIDDDFLAELQAAGAVKRKSGAEIVFLCAGKKSDLTRIPALHGGVLWVIYPKSVQIITENDVLSAGRQAGRKDVKVASFSPTLTALKFVEPRVP